MSLPRSISSRSGSTGPPSAWLMAAPHSRASALPSLTSGIGRWAAAGTAAKPSSATPATIALVHPIGAPFNRPAMPSAEGIADW